MDGWAAGGGQMKASLLGQPGLCSGLRAVEAEATGRPLGLVLIKGQPPEEACMPTESLQLGGGGRWRRPPDVDGQGPRWPEGGAGQRPEQ